MSIERLSPDEMFKDRPMDNPQDLLDYIFIGVPRRFLGSKDPIEEPSINWLTIDEIIEKYGDQLTIDELYKLKL
jgi:hypothetical protein